MNIQFPENVQSRTAGGDPYHCCRQTTSVKAFSQSEPLFAGELLYRCMDVLRLSFTVHTTHQKRRLKHFPILHFYDCSAIQFRNSRRAGAVSKASTKGSECNGWNIRRNDKTRILNTSSAYIWIIIPLWFLASPFFRVHVPCRNGFFFLCCSSAFGAKTVHRLMLVHKTDEHASQT